MERLKNLSISICIIGGLFKVQHWPFAGEILTLGALLASISYLLLVFKKE
tara:strand:+ start:240 stop:389 length:150 start_codon:yes stop_codon:yes gene_type:complete